MEDHGSRYAVVLFDGACNLCNAAVSFIIDRDPAARFRFASLQSEAGRALLARHGRSASGVTPDTVILEQEGRLYERSDAVLRIARGLRGAWKIFYVFIVVPRPLRDLLYRLVARYRYRWFGQREVCRVPTPELRTRFL